MDDRIFYTTTSFVTLMVKKLQTATVMAKLGKTKRGLGGV